MESEIFDSFYANADPAQAEPMAAYMKNICPFLGIPKPKRAALSKNFLKSHKKATTIDWAFINKCWDLEREFQYLALDYLKTVEKLLCADDVPRLKALALQKSWWDTVDLIDSLIGFIALRSPEVNDSMLAWSTDESFWLRRIAINFQLQYHEKTDTALLEKILVNNLGQKEFFVNKAIGWALREYGKTDPDFVRSFIERHRSEMASLSIREASKYL
ncbi:MAG: DNA alkylation repair protein [Coriobacteriales bacterium]|nr:DNA alkylation repair protein [Coriobacteriales bacterium]